LWLTGTILASWVEFMPNGCLGYGSGPAPKSYNLCAIG